MERISWGRAFAFGAVAVGVPWAICALIAAILLALTSTTSGLESIVFGTSPFIALVAVAIAALLARFRPPRTRAGSAGQAVLVCVLGIVVLAVAIFATGALEDFDWMFVIITFGGGIFMLGGGAPWALAGGIAASRILKTARWTRPRWAPLLWILIGAVVSAIAIAAAATFVEPVYFEQSWPSEEARHVRWNWFPLGYAVGYDPPSWFPTFALANGLGLVAIGAAIGATREPHGERGSAQP